MARVVIATPLEEELVERMRRIDERVDVAWEPKLVPPPRFPGDKVGTGPFDPAFDDVLATAEILFGFPNEKPAELARAVRLAPGLRFVQCMYAGAGGQVARANLTPEELERVAFASAAGVHATPLAEWAMLGILAFRKDLPRLRTDARARHWDHYPVPEVRGMTLLVVGLGAIGREVARLAEAFGMHVLSVRRHEGDLDELLPQADAVVATLPSTRETRGMLSAERIARMKPGAIFVNIGRGDVVDEPALTDALREGRLAGAALDVFATEPLPEDSPLWSMENVIVSPHTAAQSLLENERIVDIFEENVRRYLAGEPLVNRIRTDVFY